MNNMIRFNPELIGILKRKEIRNEREYDTFLLNADVETPGNDALEYFKIDLGLFLARVINTDDDDTFEVPIQIKYYNRYGEILNDTVFQQYLDFYMNRMSLRELTQFVKNEYGIICELIEDLEESEADEEGYLVLSEEEYNYELDMVIRDIFIDDPYITFKKAKILAKETLEISGVYCRNNVGLITVLRAEVNGMIHTFMDVDRNRDVIVSEFTRMIVNECGV